MIVILLKNTNCQLNFDIDPKCEETRLLHSINTFLLAKEDSVGVKGAYPGLIGDVTKINNKF